MSIRCRLGFHDWEILRWSHRSFNRITERWESWVTDEPTCRRCGSVDNKTS